MFRFAVIGCADITPVHGALITRTENQLTVKCNQSREEYQLRCFNMKWVGNVQNCSAGKLKYLAVQKVSHDNALVVNVCVFILFYIFY